MSILRAIWAWLLNVLIGIDLLANAMLGGDPRETISSRCHRNVDSNRLCRWLCRVLDKLDKEHCESAFESHHRRGYDTRKLGSMVDDG